MNNNPVVSTRIKGNRFCIDLTLFHRFAETTFTFHTEVMTVVYHKLRMSANEYFYNLSEFYNLSHFHYLSELTTCVVILNCISLSLN